MLFPVVYVQNLTTAKTLPSLLKIVQVFNVSILNSLTVCTVLENTIHFPICKWGLDQWTWIWRISWTCYPFQHLVTIVICAECCKKFLTDDFVLLCTVIDCNSIIFRLKEPLKEMLDPDFLLPAKLMNQNVLTDSERQIVKNKGSLQKRNVALINFVVRRDDAAQRRFISSLRDTDQEHVCNFINCNGGKRFLY